MVVAQTTILATQGNVALVVGNAMAPLHFNVIYRGANVHFEATFFDADGSPVTPTSANVNLVYPTPGGGTAQATVAMASGTPWTADWLSNVAAPGTVYGSVETAGVTPVIVRDFQFILQANAANLALDT